MNDLVGTLHAFGQLFDRLGIPYAIMGGWAGPLGVEAKLDEVLAARE